MLQTYQQVFADGTAHASDFKTILESVTGMNFTNYFNEWYYGEGYPTYSIEWNQINSSVYIQLDQVVSMPGVTPFFTNDLEIAITDDMGNTSYFRLSDINAASSLHYLGFPGTIVSVEIDPNNDIINQTGTITQNTSLVNLQDEPSTELKIFPVPATDQITVESSQADLFQIINTSGQIVQQGNLNEGQNQLDLTTLSCGTYIFRTSSTQSKIVVE